MMSQTQTVHGSHIAQYLTCEKSIQLPIREINLVSGVILCKHKNHFVRTHLIRLSHVYVE